MSARGAVPSQLPVRAGPYLGEETARSSTEHRGLRNEEGEREREGRRKYSLRKEQRKRGHLLMKTEARRNLLLQIFYQVFGLFYTNWFLVIYPLFYFLLCHD